MHKKIICLFSLFLIGSIFANNNHLQKLNSKFPYALLGDDFEILNENDLAINACEAIPSPFSLKQSDYYPRWQCFETKKSRLFCDGHRYDELEKIFYTLLVIAGQKNHERHEYLSRKKIPYSACISYAQDWHRLLKNEKYVCFSGAFITKKEKGYKGRNIYYWIFNSFKTKKGCEPYFEGWCDLKFLQDRGKNCDQS